MRIANMLRHLVFALTLLGAGAAAHEAAAQGTLSSGETGTGSILAGGGTTTWTFTANAGDAWVVRIGELTQSGALSPRIRVYSPSAVLLDWGFGAVAAEAAGTAPASGTYTIEVGDNAGTTASGTYQLSLALSGHAVSVPVGDEGGALTNGQRHTGALGVGELDVWTVSANAGDAIVVRAGELSPGSSLTPQVRLYSPTGTLLDWGYGAAAAHATATAPVSGEYLVVASDYSSGFAGSGGYQLTLACSGASVTTLEGDEGGALGNGELHSGLVDVGDLDAWTVTLAVDEAVVVRMGETTSGSALTPQLLLYSPTGVLLDWGYGAAAAEVVARATVAGQYLVVAADYSSGFAGSGGYRLSMARTGAAVAVSAGDEGGPLGNGLMPTGAALVGELDAWTFSANAGDAFVVRMGEVVPASSLTPQLRVYSPAGVLLDWGYGAAAAEVVGTAPATGEYLVVVSDYSSGFAGSGEYRLTLARSAAPFATTAGDEGGPLVPGLSFGALPPGDLDLWSLDAIAGQALIATMEETVIGSPLTPQLRLYSPAGVLLDWSYGSSRAQVSANAPMDGSYLVVASDYSSGFAGSGGYRLTPYYTTGTDDTPQAFRLMLAPPSPNPCAGRTVLRFGLAAVGDASLAIYDAQGRLVRTLLEERGKPAGEYAVEWDGGDTRGVRLRPGVYLARLQAAGRSLVQKVLLVQ